jgi:hypothetical protein
MDVSGPNRRLFNHISLMPAAGLIIVVASIVKHQPWFAVLGVIVAAVGAWLTLQRLSGRASKRSLAWVATDSAVVGIGVVLVLVFNLNGWKMIAALLPFALGSEAVATALTGVREVR